MKKTLVISDVHGRNDWIEMIKKNPDCSKFIFLGDYFDSYNISFGEQMKNFQQIINLKTWCKKEVVLLIGNHDAQYHPFFMQSGESYTGFQASVAHLIRDKFYIHENMFTMAHQEEEYLYTHAGVSQKWLDDNKYHESYAIDEFVNEMWFHKPSNFMFRGNDLYGDDYEQSPIWIRPRSLMKGNKKNLKNLYKQIVGHTQVTNIDIEGKSTGGRYFFTDTMSSTKEYIVIDDEGVHLKKL